MSGLRIYQRGDIWHVAGTVAGNRVRQSLGTRDRGTADELRAQLEARIWKRHTYGEEAIRTFEEAALHYMTQGGERRYLAPLIKHFKGRAIGTIKPGEIREASIALYPNGKPATRNRQGIIPARAVINHAHELGWCSPIRVSLFPSPKSRKHKPVDRDWLQKFMAQADADGLPHLSAIVLFMNQTGARVSEAVRLTGRYVDLDRRIAVLEKTKTEEMSIRHLTSELVLRLAALGMSDDAPVFRYTDFRAVSRRMKAVADRASIPARTSHSAGRHSFGTNAMSVPDASVKAAMEAGGWKSARLFLETYVHASEAGAELASKFDAQSGIVGTELTQPENQKRYRYGKKQ